MRLTLALKRRREAARWALKHQAEDLALLLVVLLLLSLVRTSLAIGLGAVVSPGTIASAGYRMRQKLKLDGADSVFTVMLTRPHPFLTSLEIALVTTASILLAFSFLKSRRLGQSNGPSRRGSSRESSTSLTGRDEPALFFLSELHSKARAVQVGRARASICLIDFASAEKVKGEP